MIASEKQAVHTALFDTGYDSDEQAVERMFELVLELLQERKLWYLVVRNELGSILHGPYIDVNDLKRAEKYLDPDDERMRVQGRPAHFWKEAEFTSADCECGHLKLAHVPQASVPADSKSTKRTIPPGCPVCLKSGTPCGKVYPVKDQWGKQTPRMRGR